MRTIQLLNDYVLVDRIPEPESTKSGLILPDRARELTQLGRIVSISNDHKIKKSENLQVGQLVLFKKFGGIPYPVNPLENPSKFFYFFHLDEIIAVLYNEE